MKTPRTVSLTLALSLCTVYAAAGADRARYISHRGESLDAPENTMAAFRLAVDRGSDGFECDIYRTADNEIVCIHDATTTRTTGTNLTVAASTLEQLRALDAGSWKGAQFAGERIPTLSEALSLARDDFEIYVEIKCGTEILPRLTEVLAAESNATPARVVFIAFSTNVVTTLRQQLPDYRAYWLSSLSTNASGALTPSAASVAATLQATGASGADVQDHSALSAAYVSGVKAAGCSFHVWTVNSVARAAGLAAMGVDTVTSDCGAALVAALVEPSVVNPVVRWTFDGGAATNCGSGGATYDATLYGDVAYTNGVDGGGLRFLGASQGYAALPYTFGDQGAVAFWYKPARFYNYNSVFDNSVDPNRWEMWLDSGGAVRFRLASGQGDIAYGNLSSQHNGSNVWYHFAVTWARYALTNQARLYVNGVERYATNIAAWVTPGNTVYFGGHTGNTPAEGVLDDVRVYDVALTAGQVQAVHAEVAARAPAVHLTLDGVATNSGTFGAKCDAALFGEPAWTNGWNDKGKALALDGVDDYASVPYRLNFSGSVALWCYTPGPWYNYNSIFDNSADANHYESWIDSTGTLSFRPAGNTWKQSASFNLGSASNRWHHIVGTWDALSSNMVLYVDGVERGRAANTSGVAWPVPGSLFYLGGGQAANTNALNFTSDVQIYETPLSASRVAEIYGEFGRRGKLLAYVPFDGTAVDVAGSNAVVLGGSPAYVKTQSGLLKGLSCRGPGTGDNASISNVLGSSVGTIALWYYARGPWYNYQTVLDNSVNSEYWESWIDTNGYLKVRVSNKADGGLVQYDLDNLQKGSNIWCHIAYVWDRAARQARLYIDGSLRATSTLSDAGWVAPASALHLAGGHPNNVKGNGIWDEVRVYDRALTVEEIAALMAIPQRVTGTILTVN